MLPGTYLPAILFAGNFSGFSANVFAGVFDAFGAASSGRGENPATAQIIELCQQVRRLDTLACGWMAGM